jgi:hypothetical protein
MHNKLYCPKYAKRILFDHLGLKSSAPTYDQSLDNTFQWIKASFDANNDGGSSAYYRIGQGWKGSYPETTGYLIPTIYDYASIRKSEEWKSIAKRAADWLLSIQASEGGWQGLQIGIKCDLRIFNTAMILDGLAAAYRIEKDNKYLDSAIRGVDWCLSKMDKNGFFSKNNVVGGGTFDTLVCACMLMVVQLLPEERQQPYIDKIKFSLDAHLTFQTNNGWFKNCNFKSSDESALLHHIGYTIEGLVLSSEILGDDSYYRAAKKTADKLLGKFETELKLPAFFKADWSTLYDLGSKETLCLTGCSQVAIVFQRIYRKENDLAFRNAALKLNDLVASIANYKSSDSGLCFGIPGSYPIDGNYQGYQIVNWAAKYHAESILLSMDACMSKSV